MSNARMINDQLGQPFQRNEFIGHSPLHQNIGEANQDGPTALLKQRCGRSPRILHVGNIANNAYNNAKLLNKAGFDCDVICYDYYHIMGCPEWEDADFKGDVGDHFRPDWTRVDLRGFERPHWFAQGPYGLCIEYLCARRAGDLEAASQLWGMLAHANKTSAVKPQSFLLPLRKRRMLRAMGAWRYLRAATTPLTVARKLDELARRLALVARRQGLVAQRQGLVARRLGLVARRLGLVTRDGIPHATLAYLVRVLIGPLTMVSHATLAYPVRVLYATLAFLVRVLIGLLTMVSKVGRWSLARVTIATAVLRQLVGLSSRTWARKLPTRARQLDARLKALFPERSDAVSVSDLVPYCAFQGAWNRLFRHYDLIVAFSTDPILPMLAGRAYFAFEHGTLREIPFQTDCRGRLTALAYNAAVHTFVTNFDCLANARRLCGERCSFVNHPFDEDHSLNLTGVGALREELRTELDADFLYFFPTRQDWVPGTGYADKANHLFFWAFATLRREGYRVGAVCCSWGRNVEESKRLLAELGCGNHVRWVEPMGVVRFERTARACDIVVDQFKLGAFGGITFKSLAAAVPVMTYLDEVQLRPIFPVPPPVINCRTSEDIVFASRRLIGTSGELDGLRKASRDWVKTYHSARETVDIQVQVYARFLVVSPIWVKRRHETSAA